MKKWLDCEDGHHHCFDEAEKTQFEDGDTNYSSLCGRQHIDDYLFKMAVEDNEPENFPKPCGDCLERSKA